MSPAESATRWVLDHLNQLTWGAYKPPNQWCFPIVVSNGLGQIQLILKKKDNETSEKKSNLLNAISY